MNFYSLIVFTSFFFILFFILFFIIFGSNKRELTANGETRI